MKAKLTLPCYKNSLATLIVSLLVSCSRHPIDDPSHKILRVPIADDAKSLDPAVAYDSISLELLQSNQESLFQYKYNHAPLELEPLLAEAMPQVSADKKTYTIRIKKGVHFQDDAAFPGGKGRELKAQDFIYNWKRLLIPALQSGGTWIFEDKVIGYSELKKRFFEDKSTPLETLLQSPIEGFQALDEYTIQIKLLKPYPQLLYVLAMGFGAPMAAEVTAKYGQEGLTQRMVGTGPYLLKNYVRGSKINLVKNPNYRDAKFEGHKLPLIDELEFQITKEEQPAWLKFQKAELDLGFIPKDNYSSAIQSSKLSPELEKKGIQLQKSAEPYIVYLVFNMKDKLLGANKKLRQAIARAINRDYWIDLFLNERATKATSAVPIGIAGHVERPHPMGDFDLADAKKLLTEAGFPNGKGLPIFTFDLRNVSPTQRQQGEYMTKAMAEIGIQLKVEANTFPAFLEKEKKGNLQIFLGGWSADYPDAENFLQLLYSKNAAPGPNYSSYSNKEFDKIYEQIAVMDPSPRRDTLIRKAEDIAFEDGVWSMLYYPLRFSLSQAWVKNYHPNAIIFNDWKYLDLDYQQKKAFLGNNP